MTYGFEEVHTRSLNRHSGTLEPEWSVGGVVLDENCSGGRLTVHVKSNVRVPDPPPFPEQSQIHVAPPTTTTPPSLPTPPITLSRTSRKVLLHSSSLKEGHTVGRPLPKFVSSSHQTTY